MSEENDKYVKLISLEGNEFLMEKSIAINCSEMLRGMLESNFKESQDNSVRFPEISAPILEKVIEYMYYKVKHEKSSGKIPQFDIEPEMALELMLAANYFAV